MIHIVHELIVRPQAGLEAETMLILEELGGTFAREPGYVEGYTLDGLAEGGLLSRISVWDSNTAADRSLKLDQTVALRERLEALAKSAGVEPLLDIAIARAAKVAVPAAA